MLPKRAAAFNLYTQEQADENAAAMETEEVIFGDDKGLLIEKNGTVTKLGYELGADYNDPKWEEVLNQLTEEETEELFLHGYVKTEKLESIGKPLAREADGPAQIGSFNQNPTGTGFPNAGIMAQSWNTGLSREMGRACRKRSWAVWLQWLVCSGCEPAPAVLLMAAITNIIPRTVCFPAKCAAQL